MQIRVCGANWIGPRFVRRPPLNLLTRLLTTFAVLALLPLAGCGDKSATAEPESGAKADAELLALVSAAVEVEGESARDAVEYVDFAFARRQLALPEDADVYDTASKDGDVQIASLLGVLPYAAGPDSSPLTSAIDGGAIQAAADRSIVGEPALLAIKTVQPFSEIAAVLRREGYAASGDLLVSSEGSSKASFPVVADAGGGVVVLGGSESFVRKVLSNRDATLSPASELIDEVPGPARMADATATKCVLAVAAGQNLSPREGEYLVRVEGEADEARLTLADSAEPTPNGEVVFGDVTTEGDTLRVEFTYSDLLNPVVSSLPGAGDVYGC